MNFELEFTNAIIDSLEYTSNVFHALADRIKEMDTQGKSEEKKAPAKIETAAKKPAEPKKPAPAKNAPAKAETPAKKAPAKRGAGRPKKSETPEPPAVPAAGEYEGQPAVELFKLCRARDIQVEARKPAAYYVDVLKKADAEVKEPDSWDEESGAPGEEEEDWTLEE